MTYDRVIGEKFWLEFDRATLYNPSFMQVVGAAGAGPAHRNYRTHRQANTYPKGFKEDYESQRASWETIAQVQRGSFDTYLGTDWNDIDAAFMDFGQGVLLSDDPRRLQENNAIHMMDGQDDNPPIGYARWHCSLRVIQLLQIGDHAWWDRLAFQVGTAWAVQSVARPRQQSTSNPGIPQDQVDQLRSTWHTLSPEQLDAQYDIAAGYHPSPFSPI